MCMSCDYHVICLDDRKMTEYAMKLVNSYLNPTKGAKEPSKQTTPTSTPTSTQPSPPKNDEKKEPSKQNITSNSGNRGIESGALVNAKGKLKPTETVERTIPVVGTSNSGRGKGPGHNIKEEEEKKEFFDKEELLVKKVKTVADWVKRSKHVIFFTGAGISTRWVWLWVWSIE